MHLVIMVRELLTNSLLLGGIRATCSIVLMIDPKTAWEVMSVLVFAMLEGPEVFLVSFSMLLQT
jgi:hypothetical protein